MSYPFYIAPPGVVYLSDPFLRFVVYACKTLKADFCDRPPIAEIRFDDLALGMLRLMGGKGHIWFMHPE